MRRGRGFTLFELIAVMVLSAVLLAMVAPSLRGFAAASQARDAAATLLAAADLARQRAMQDGTPWRLTIDTNANTARLFYRDGYAYAAPADAWGRDIAIDRAVTLSWASMQDESHITFAPDGSAEPRRLRVAGPRGDAFVLAVNAATGRYAVRQDAEVSP